MCSVDSTMKAGYCYLFIYCFIPFLLNFDSFIIHQALCWDLIYKVQGHTYNGDTDRQIMQQSAECCAKVLWGLAAIDTVQRQCLALLRKVRKGLLLESAIKPSLTE